MKSVASLQCVYFMLFIITICIVRLGRCAPQNKGKLTILWIILQKYRWHPSPRRWFKLCVFTTLTLNLPPCSANINNYNKSLCIISNQLKLYTYIGTRSLVMIKTRPRLSKSWSWSWVLRKTLDIFTIYI